MTLHDKHITLIESVNQSVTLEERTMRSTELTMWRRGVEDAGIKLDLCACDMYYLVQGIDRPMCCGVWLDWKPAN